MWLFWGVVFLVQEALTSEEFKCGKHLNPQEFMIIPDIIRYWEYPTEQYAIPTEDGYKLQANRIPYGKNCSEKTGPRPVVLLVIDVLLEGRSWIANLPGNSLGFILADVGYDVWILNNRGTIWSRKHKRYSIFQREFWDFSFHETAIYDIPGAIDFILQKTKQKSLYYIGFSQGCSLGLVAFSVKPQLAKKVKLSLCFAPLYILVDIKGPFSFLLNLPDALIWLLWGNKEFCLISNEQKVIHAKICSYRSIDRFCLECLFLLEGRNENNLNVSRADVYAGIAPDYTSVKQFIHWGQVAKTNQFKYFDYGRKKNQAVYNMSSPPFYKIEDSVVPTAVWSAGQDNIASTRNVELLLPRISNLVFYKHIPDWQHVDFIWGLDAPERLYKDVLYLMQKHK